MGKDSSLQRTLSSHINVSGLTDLVLGRQNSFTVNAAGAQSGVIDIAVIKSTGQGHGGERHVDHQIGELGNRKYQVSFTPEAGVNHQAVIKYNGTHIQGSPFEMKGQPVDVTSILIHGDGHKTAHLNSSSSFIVDLQSINAQRNQPPEMKILGPGGAAVEAEIVEIESQKYCITWTPLRVGMYAIAVAYSGSQLTGSPFKVSVADRRHVMVTQTAPASTRALTHFAIDCTKAGSGELEVIVRNGDDEDSPLIPSTVREDGALHYSLHFQPVTACPHAVAISFDGEHVPGSPFYLQVGGGADAVIVSDPEPAHPNLQPITLRVETEGAGEGTITARVSREGQSLRSSLQLATGLKTYTLSFTPDEDGDYTVDVWFNELSVPGSPFHVRVDPIEEQRLKKTVSYLPRGRNSAAMEETYFDVDSHNVALENLSISITGPANQTVPYRTSSLEGKGTYRVSFTPSLAGIYQISVRVHGNALPGSPYSYEVTLSKNKGSSEHVLQLPHLSLISGPPTSVSNTGTILFEVGHRDRHSGRQPDADNHISAKVRAPNGELVSSQLTTDSSNQVRVEYQSPYVGSHTVDIFYAGSKMGGSPYTVDVFDLNRVTVRKLNNIDVGQETEITVLSRSSGTSDVECRIVDPSGHTIPFRQSTTSEGVSVWYTPIQEGLYTVHVYVGGVEIPASPLSQSVRGQDPPSSPLKPSVDPNRITVEGEGLFQGQKGRKAPIIVHLHGSGAAPQLDVQGPASSVQGGGNVWTSVEQVNEEVYQLFYTPNQVGQFSVSIKWGGTDIPGSPFEPRVTDPGAVKVVNGLHNLLDANGQLPLVVGQICHIAIDAVEAGPGSLRAVFKDSSGNQVRSEVKKSDAGMYMINFTPPSKGEYTLAMYWNNVAVPGKALRGYARDETPLSSDKVAVSGAGLTAAIVGHTAEFILDGSKIGSGQPTLSLKAVKPGDPDIHVQSHQHSRGVYMCSYVPTVHGLYDLNLGWGHRQLEGSPRRVVVNAPPQARKVTMDTEQWATSPGGSHSGRRGGKVMMRLIDTNLAGPGELVARCSGPTQRALCKLETRGDGTYSLTVKPAEGGLHRLEVTYSGEHIPGSPHEFIFEPPFDPSRVMVSGPGVRHGILAAFQSQFRVDTKEAGGGNLTVKVRGPKGSFKVVMEKESERSIVCSYDPSEVGLYIVSVQWSGESVPGSPFYVHIFDTYEELSIYEKSGQVPQPLVNGRGPPNGLSLKKPRGRSLYNMAPPPLMSSLPLVGPGGLSPPSHRVPYQQHPQLNRQRAATTVRTGPSPRFGY